jgi:hypothetical protein
MGKLYRSSKGKIYMPPCTLLELRKLNIDVRENYKYIYDTITYRLLHLLLHHRLVPPSLAGLAGVRRGGEPILCMEVLAKVVFFNRLS